MKKLIIILMFMGPLLLLSCDNRTDEEKKLELDNLYSSIKSIPSSMPCENLKGYQKLKSRDIQYGMNIYKDIYEVKIKDYEKKCLKIQEEKRLEELRVAELKKLGDWTVGNYVDEFGDDTGEHFMQIKSRGTFSNTATQNSSLNVTLMYDKKERPWFRFYEYAGSNPIKGYYSKEHLFPCKVKSGDIVFNLNLKLTKGGSALTIREYIGKSERKIWKDYTDATDKLINEMKKGSLVKFSCFDMESTASTYRFDLDFSYYENALRKFNEL
ncbi:MAG: hypothetical protein HN636_04180 [Cryomorphaceae bacterium]|jgi:hypothetical protein|nr:hypothetical protein [Candidatus Neomarinimicrobiota bacterium]MBT5772196.1 hypothetical protein [Flavobacteriaceae bacterium]MBT6689129.1 hypothetical protein [Flavobacteriaceae bacterium]MBT7433970.1 hypothetical protein [Candidatus Neomarinimicrobiota bacterium]MBT7683638.1 hypothetical protein [Cryomorphaceae bacterium]